MVRQNACADLEEPEAKAMTEMTAGDVRRQRNYLSLNAGLKLANIQAADLAAGKLPYVV